LAIIIALAVWTLTVKTLSSLLSTGFDPSDYTVFRILFGMIFIVIIALKFRRSLLMLPALRRSVVQVRAVVLIACDRSEAPIDNERQPYVCAGCGDPGARKRALARSRSGQARGCKRKIAVAANECSMPSSLPELTVPALPAFPLSLLSISPVHHAAPRGNFQMTRFRRSLCANERGCETSRKDQGNYTEGILDCVGPGRKNVLQQEFGADERQEQREREP
jgi:hypothetical protein